MRESVAVLIPLFCVNRSCCAVGDPSYIDPAILEVVQQSVLMTEIVHISKYSTVVY